MNNGKREPDYRIGYGRPPEHSRFKKGQSGNPMGRRCYTATGRAQQRMQQELHRKLTVREAGKAVRMPAIQAILRNQILLAAQGNVAAIKEVLRTWSLAVASEPMQGPFTMTWLPPQEPQHATAKHPGGELIHKIERIIVDPNQPNDLTKLTEKETDELKRLLAKARQGSPQEGTSQRMLDDLPSRSDGARRD